MKALFINGGPRKNWTTFQMLESAMNGAADAGADVEMVHLYAQAFKGCVSCFACKRKGATTNGLCAFRDPLTPILEKAHAADIIVIGSPIYFSSVTGSVRSFMERLMFPILTYNAKIDETTGDVNSSLLGKIVPTAMIYTMGCSEEMSVDWHYPEIFGQNSRFLDMLFGYTEALCTYNSYQFDDYTKYDVADYVEPMRATYRTEQFPEDLKNAYALGQRLVQKAKDLV